jgi:acyl-CoA thioester hydrolase
VQVVHSDIDFLESVRWRDVVRVVVSCREQGTTSFTVAFTVLRHTHGEPEQVAMLGRSIYVVVSPWT